MGSRGILFEIRQEKVPAVWMGHAGVVLGVVPCSDYLPGVGDYMKRGLLLVQ